MTVQTRNHLAARARVLKALAHPARLQAVDELAKGERCVCELQQLIGSDMSTVSRHLAILREAGLVTAEHVGRETFYSLNQERLSVCCGQLMVRFAPDEKVTHTVKDALSKR